MPFDFFATSSEINQMNNHSDTKYFIESSYSHCVTFNLLSLVHWVTQVIMNQNATHKTKSLFRYLFVYQFHYLIHHLKGNKENVEFCPTKNIGYQPLVLIQAAVSAPILEAICPPSSITVLVMSPFDLLVLPTITNFIPSNGLLELKIKKSLHECKSKLCIMARKF